MAVYLPKHVDVIIDDYAGRGFESLHLHFPVKRYGGELESTGFKK